MQMKQKGSRHLSGCDGGVWSVSFTQTNTPFVVFLACVTSPAGDGVHLAHLVLEPNVLRASVVK